MKLNIGCGADYRDGWQNVDISREVKADKYLDISKEKLPYADGSVEDIYMAGVLEQIPDNAALRFVLNECYRVLRKTGELMVVVPNAQFVVSYQDPFDCRRFIEKTFDYFCGGTKEFELYGKTYGFTGWGKVEASTNKRGIITAVLTK